jgi:hypothetical protein
MCGGGDGWEGGSATCRRLSCLTWGPPQGDAEQGMLQLIVGAGVPGRACCWMRVDAGGLPAAPPERSHVT